MFQHDLFGGRTFVTPTDKRPPPPPFRDSFQEELDTGVDYPMPCRLAPEPLAPRETFQVDYREAYEVMLDALRNEEDPWIASISIDPQRSVPIGNCELDGSITLSEVIRLAEMDRQYELADELDALAEELRFTDDWSM